MKLVEKTIHQCQNHHLKARKSQMKVVMTIIKKKTKNNYTNNIFKRELESKYIKISENKISFVNFMEITEDSQP